MHASSELWSVVQPQSQISQKQIRNPARYSVQTKGQAHPPLKADLEATQRVIMTVIKSRGGQREKFDHSWQQNDT